MAKRDALIEDFKKLLDRIPDNYSLPQWQYAYRQIIYLMGLKILEKFPNDVFGPDPSEPDESATYTIMSASPANSGGPGGHPNTICRLVCVVLDVNPQPGKPRPKGPR